MAKLKRVNHFRSEEIYAYRFDCPGCHGPHMPVVNDKQGGVNWAFNGDLDKPTFSPSLLLRWEESEGVGNPPTKHVCHSFIQDGNIQFLSDCTHRLAGQTVELPEVST